MSQGGGGAGERLGVLLDEWTELIAARFEARVRTGITASSLSQAEIIDGLRTFLRRTAALLRSGTDTVPEEGASPDMAEHHGQQRLRLGFDIGALTREYGFLRQCLWDIIDERGYRPSVRERRLLFSCLEIAESQVVARYVELRDRELRAQAAGHLAFLAHEIRNPLQSVRLGLHLLREHDAWPRHPAAEGVLRAVARLSDLVDTSLTHGRLVAKVELRSQRIAVRPFLEELVAESAIDAQTKGISFEIEALDDLWTFADERLLRSAVSNFIRNGVKFTRKGTICVRARTDGPKLVIEIEDSCGGLPAGARDRLFDPFVQANDDRSGFGLGLAIARQAVAAHHGDVFVEDRPGKGCIFGLRLPSASSDTPEPEPA